MLEGELSRLKKAKRVLEEEVGSKRRSCPRASRIDALSYLFESYTEWKGGITNLSSIGFCYYTSEK